MLIHPESSCLDRRQVNAFRASWSKRYKNPFAGALAQQSLRARFVRSKNEVSSKVGLHQHARIGLQREPHGLVLWWSR